MSVKILDAQGLKCPMPIIKAKQEIDAMSPGDLLEVHGLGRRLSRLVEDEQDGQPQRPADRERLRREDHLYTRVGEEGRLRCPLPTQSQRK
jgi:Sulfurtransferase TusA